MAVLNERLNVTSTITYYVIDSVKYDAVDVVRIIEKKPPKVIVFCCYIKFVVI